MSTHTCPHPTCTAEVVAGMLACRPHWYMLPAHLRAEVWAAYRNLSHNPTRHRAAVAACLTWYRENT